MATIHEMKPRILHWREDVPFHVTDKFNMTELGQWFVRMKGSQELTGPFNSKVSATLAVQTHKLGRKA